MQVDKREPALRAAVQLHNLAREAYGAGFDDFGDEARHAEVDALRWRSGEDLSAARVRIAKAAKHLLTLLAR